MYTHMYIYIYTYEYISSIRPEQARRRGARLERRVEAQPFDTISTYV